MHLCDFSASPDLNFSLSLLIDIYLSCLDTITPEFTIYNVKEAEAWASETLQHLVRQRDTKKVQVDKLFQNKAFEEFKILRNQVKRSVVKSKHDSIRGRLSDLDQNPKKFWSELNKISPMNKKGEKCARYTIHDYK